MDGSLQKVGCATAVLKNTDVKIVGCFSYKESFQLCIYNHTMVVMSAHTCKPNNLNGPKVILAKIGFEWIKKY